MLSLITPINPSDKNVGAVTVAVNKNLEIKQKTQTNLQSIKRQKHEKRKKTKD